VDRQHYRDAPLHTFTCLQLSAVCRWRGISGFSKLSKRGLVQLVEAELLKSNEALFDTERQIVAWPKHPINDTDPISQGDLTNRNPLYIFTMDASAPSSASSSGTTPPIRRVHRFDPVSLVEMMLRTGDTFNPYNRVQLTVAEILQLEHAYTSCLRGHPGTPVDKQAILSMRPDMQPAQIPGVPSRADLGLVGKDGDPGADPFPGPIEDFAPWLTSVGLQTLANRRKMAVEDERQVEETRTFLRGRVTSALDATLMFLSPISGPLTEMAAAAVVDATLRIYTPMLLEALDELFYSARAEVRIVLPIVATMLIQAREDLPDEIMRHAAGWVLAMIIDETLKNSAQAFEGNPADTHAEWTYRFIRNLDIERSTAALVRESVTLQHFTLLVA
jgi:hypothetical protein